MKIILIFFIVFICCLLQIRCKHYLKVHKSIDNELTSVRILQSETTGIQLSNMTQNTQNTSSQNQSCQNQNAQNQNAQNASTENQSNMANGAKILLDKSNCQPIDQPPLIIPSQPGNDISFIFVGDIMMSRGIRRFLANNKSNDMTFPFQLVKSVLANYDIRVANLESGITNSTTPLKKVIPCPISNSTCCDMKCFFKVSPDVLKGIVDYAGFNLLTIENNHIDDYENERQDTINVLTNYKTAFIDYFHPFKISNFKGCNLEFYAYNFFHSQFSYDTMKTHMQDQLRNASSDSFKIYYLHGGKEYDFDPLKYQIDFSHAAIDAGADMIIFSHTHVIGKHEIYKNKHIVYGLGNFVFDERAVITKKFYASTFDLHNCKNVVNFKLLNGTRNSEYQPVFDDF